MTSNLHRPRYVSWWDDSPPAATATTAGLDPASVPLLHLSPPEASGRDIRAPSPHSQSRSWSAPTWLAAAEVAEGEGDDDEARRGEDATPVAPNDSSGEDDWPLLHPEDFHLQRSSPVISRRHRPVSWHAGGADASPPSSSESTSPAGSPSLHQRAEVKPNHSSPAVQEEKRPLSSLSSTLNQFLSNLPFTGQQGLAERQRGRGMTGCSGPHAQAQHSDGRSCERWRSADIFKSSCELEKENAHFIVVDLVLEVLENVKWTLSLDETTPTMATCRRTRNKARGCTPPSPRNARQRIQASQSGDAGNEAPKTLSVLSTDSGFEECGTMKRCDSTENAERLAQQLVLDFKTAWCPSRQPRRGRQSLRSSLQELPGGGVVSGGDLAEEIKLRTRMRGSLSWAPPRFQIIFTTQPAHRRSHVVALQHFLCAGCGTAVEPRFIKRLRYCEYFGRYFCDCCHGGGEAVIPGRVLTSWDFGRHPVSDFSKQLLDSVWQQPLFDLTCVGKTLYGSVKELDKFRELQEQLLGVRKLLQVCRLSGRLMSDFERLPGHLTERLHLFSMEDLCRVKRGELVAQARVLLHSAIEHIENCELCLARGFVCEFCREKDVIFPFQSDACKRCPVCKACFHTHCFVERKCPKCSRIQSRKREARRDEL